ncbi:hypothetical protein RUM43_000401 [Polyplax serrata]|uniref:Uncharacterized protein n=1 Tax=Polyplax serrata TaxID=468196 RepID=A0AAN8SDW8_POLSC
MKVEKGKESHKESTENAFTSGYPNAENTVGDALQRKLERLNSTILSQDEQARRQHQYYGHSGYSEDSDYTSDLNYPIGQHPNSSASQFRTAAQLMRTPETSLETSRENSYERDDGPVQVHMQGGHYFAPNHSSQQGRMSQNYAMQQSYRNYNEADGEPLYYNSRPRDFKEYSSQAYGHVHWTSNGHSNAASRKRVAGRRPSLERQTTLYDDQYYTDQQYYDERAKQQYQIYGDYYSQDFTYQNERYGKEEEDKQWDSGGYYYPDNYADTFADNYQNIVNEKRSSKKLPSTVYSNSNQDRSYYSPQTGTGYNNETIDESTNVSASVRRKLLKQQRQSSDNYSTGGPCWQSDDRSTVWHSAENGSGYYEEYTTMNATINTTTPVTTPMHPPKKRTLPQIRAPSRIKASAMSLPQTPVRQLPNPLDAVNKQRVSAPVSRTASADYEQADPYESGTYNENYNYAYASNDNLVSDKFSAYPTESRTTDNYLINYKTAENYQDNYENKENYPEMEGNYQNVTEQYQNVTEQYPNVDNFGNSYVQNLNKDEYYPGDYYQEDTLKGYYDTNVTQGTTQKKFLGGRRAHSPFIQQNTDSLESRDDELRDESFETAVDSICSSLPMQRTGTEYSSMDTSMDYKLEPAIKPLNQQQHILPENEQQWQVPSAHQNQQPQQLQQQAQQPQAVQQQQQQPTQQQQQSTGMLGGLLGQLTKSPSQYMQQQQQQQQQQGQKPDQRSRDQPNLLTNPALAAMNVTKGIFSSITNAVNNTVQSINKQQKNQKQQQQQQQQQVPLQQTENQVQRIQVTKKGSLKQQDSFECQRGFRSQRNSFDSQIQDYTISEEPEFTERKDEEEYYETDEKYYDYDEKDYYENHEDDFAKDIEIPEGESELDHLETALRNREAEGGVLLPKRIGHLKHQDTIESEGKRSDRSYLRQQDSLDSCADELIMHNSGLVNGASPTELDRFGETRTGSVEAMRNGTVDSSHIEALRKRGSGHDNSLIEPYHPGGMVQDIQKEYSSSPPSIQKQQSIDLEGIDEEDVPDETLVAPDELEKPIPFDVQPVEPIKMVVPERRKYTAKERWHRAYNIVVQQLNVSHI